MGIIKAKRIYPQSNLFDGLRREWSKRNEERLMIRRFREMRKLRRRKMMRERMDKAHRERMNHQLPPPPPAPRARIKTREPVCWKQEGF